MQLPELPKTRYSRDSLLALVAIVQFVITLIVAPLATWALLKIVNHGERITAIETSRFTSDDARSMIEAASTAYMKDREVTEQRLRNIERLLDRLVVKLNSEAPVE